MLFMPKHMRVRRQTHTTCRWCGAHSKTSDMYKLRDGPVDWWFCDDAHALEWLDYRHRSPELHKMLKRHPYERDLGGKTIDEWVRDRVS